MMSMARLVCLMAAAAQRRVGAGAPVLDDGIRKEAPGGRSGRDRLARLPGRLAGPSGPVPAPRCAAGAPPTWKSNVWLPILATVLGRPPLPGVAKKAPNKCAVPALAKCRLLFSPPRAQFS